MFARKKNISILKTGSVLRVKFLYFCRKLSIMQYTAIIEECHEGGYVAQCAEIKNAFAQGETINEAKENLLEVINLLLECEKEEQIRKMNGKKFFFSKIAVL